mgnify:CR=1 FL=1
MTLLTKDALARIITDVAIRHDLYHPYHPYHPKQIYRYCPDRRVCYAIRDAGVAYGVIRPGYQFDVRVVFGQDFRDWSNMEFHQHLNFDLDGTIYDYGPYTQEIVDWHHRPLWGLGWHSNYPRTGEGLLTLDALGESLASFIQTIG